MIGALATLATLAGFAWLWWVVDRMSAVGGFSLAAYAVGATAGEALGAWAWLPVFAVALFVTARHFWPAKEVTR